MYLPMNAPARTPMRLVHTSASAAPKNTMALEPGWAANPNVASWVLSPISAKKTVANVVKKAWSMGKKIKKLEVPVGFAPTNGGFADRSVSYFTTAPRGLKDTMNFG